MLCFNDQPDATQSPSRARRRPGAARLACRLLLLALPWLGAPAAAATLADAVNAALIQADQTQRVSALRGVGSALRQTAGGLIAADPALRLKTLSDSATEDTGAYELEAMVDLPLFLPGQRQARQALAGAVGTHADGLARYLSWQMAGEVREAAWAAALAGARMEQAATAVAAAETLTGTVAKRASAGELPRMDLLTALQEAQARVLELTSMQIDYNRAIATYVQLTGQPQLPKPLIEPLPTLPEPLLLPDDHPMLAANAGALAQAQAERGRVGADGRGHPVLSLGGKRAREARGVEPLDALQLELSIPFGMKRHNAVALAEAEREVTDQLTDLHRLRRSAERDLTAAALAWRGAGQTLAVAERRAALAEEVLRTTRRAFDLGESDLAAVLRAEDQARNARLDLALHRLEQGHAIARLNQALGLLPQ